MITDQMIIKHYRTPAIKETIVRVSTDGEYSRAGMKCKPKAYMDKVTHESKDIMDWYRGTGPYTQRKTLKKIDMSTGSDGVSVNIHRTLYWTLNIFDKSIYEVDYKTVETSDSPLISRSNTVGYTFGIDIDREHGQDIHDPLVKTAVEDMAQFYTDKLREYLPNSVYCLYSGGGIYVMVHHKALDCYFDKFRQTDEWDTMLLTMLDSLDDLIGDLRDEFFKLHPEHRGKVKPDQLNGSQRVFKTIFSIHKSLDYAVVPLDPLNIKIDFEKATLPLSDDTVSEGKEWYTKFDDGAEFLNNVMKPYFVKSHKARTRPYIDRESAIPISSVAILDMVKWSPCMRNLYNMPTCGEGQTRALAILTSYMGQIGIEEDDARLLFEEVADRWGAKQSNIFNSYFRTMKVPTCARLNSDDGKGFPKGVSIRSLCVCKPDVRCMSVPSPRYYTDNVANIKRLLTPVPEKQKVKKVKCESADDIPVF